MFTNLFFLILVLLLITLSPESWTNIAWKYSPQEAFLRGIVLFFFVIGLIGLQNLLFSKFIRRHTTKMLTLANLELLIFLCVYHFFLGASRIFIPLELQVVSIAFSLLMYFGGLAVFHVTSFNIQRISSHMTSRWLYANRELQLLLPFAIPLLLITLFSDVLTHTLSDEMKHLLFESNSMWSFLFVGAVTLIFILGMMIYLPYWIQKIWRCQSLTNHDLRKRLEHICRVAHFKYADLKTWTVLDHALTAAIIGIVPRYRYVMFSKRLLEELPSTSVEAILAHEIGHNYHRHLWIYPFIILGASVFISFISFFLPEVTDSFSLLSLFIVYAIAVAVYFRVIFGFFSRMFERQADLHVFVLEIPSQYLIDAFEHIAVATGNSHNVPNWHHYSIQKRINFLKAAIAKPSLIAKHHRYVRYCVFAYFFLLGLSLVALFYFS